MMAGFGAPLHAVERLVWTQPDAPGLAIATSVFPDSGSQTLRRVTGEGEDVVLPDNTPAIRWAGWLPPAFAAHETAILAIGTFGEHPSIEEWETAGPGLPDASLVPPWPAGPELQRWLPWRAFGQEERVVFHLEDGVLKVVAKPGTQWAGLALERPGRLPDVRWCPEPSLHLDWVAEGSWTVAVEEEGSGLGPRPLVELKGAGSRSFPLNDLPPGAFRWVVLAPAEGKLDLRDFSLRSGGRNAAEPSELARWDWSQQPARWIAHSESWRELAVAYPKDLKTLSDASEWFAQVRKTGRRILAVEGDPAMILPTEQAKIRDRTVALASLPATVRPDALQYDIEPYLLPGYTLDPASWNRRWLETLRGIKAASAGLPVEAVLAWWLPNDPAHAEFLRELPSVVDRIVIMNYRTAPLDALQSAAWWMEWGARANRPVAIAMEFGPLPAQQAQRFVPAERGNLWFVAFPGRGTLAIALEKSASPPMGARAFQPDGPPVTRLPDSVTFHRDPASAKPLLRALRELLPSVAGKPRPVYLHEPPELEMPDERPVSR